MGFIYLINTGRRLEPFIEKDWTQPAIGLYPECAFFFNVPGYRFPEPTTCTRVSGPNRYHGTDKAEPLPG